jgi:hypothetical protein
VKVTIVTCDVCSRTIDKNGLYRLVARQNNHDVSLRIDICGVCVASTLGDPSYLKREEQSEQRLTRVA